MYVHSYVFRTGYGDATSPLRPMFLNTNNFRPHAFTCVQRRTVAVKIRAPYHKFEMFFILNIYIRNSLKTTLYTSYYL